MQFRILTYVFTILSLVFIPLFLTDYSQASTLPPPEFILSLSMKDQAITENDSLKVEDVLRCQGDAGSCNKISSWTIGSSPKPGSVRIISRDQVVEALNPMLSAARIQIEWSGAYVCQVTATATVIGTAEVLTAIQATVENILKDYDRLRIVIGGLQVSQEIQVRPKPYSFDFSDLELTLRRALEGVNQTVRGVDSESLGSPLEKQNIQTSFLIQQPMIKASTVNVIVRWQVQVLSPVLKKNMKLSDLLMTEDIEWQWVNFKRDIILLPSELSHKRAVRPLNAGTVLSPRMLVAEQLVRKGDLVSVLVEKGAIEVRTQAKALSIGEPGETIDISMQSFSNQNQFGENKVLKAVVIDKQNVRVKM